MIKLVETLLLSAVYLAITGSLTLADWLCGLAIGFLLRHTVTGFPHAVHLRRFPIYLFGLAGLVLKGSLTMLWVLLRGRPEGKGGELIIHLPIKTATGAVALGYAATASPGTAFVRCEDNVETLHFYSVTTDSPEELTEQLETFYVRYQRGLFD